MKIDNWLEGHWALILGSSSGFGAEVSKKLSEYGVNILGIHLDRKGTMKNVEKIVKSLDFIEGLLRVYIINDVIKNISENLIMLKNETFTGMVSMDKQKNKYTMFLIVLSLLILDMVFILMFVRKTFHTCGDLVKNSYR